VFWAKSSPPCGQRGYLSSVIKMQCATADGDTVAITRAMLRQRGSPLLPKERPIPLKSEQVQPKPAPSPGFTDGAARAHDDRGTELDAGEILILCPRTSTPVTTGLRIDWVVFKSLPPVAVPLRCRACGLIHRWKPRDAWINTNSQLSPLRCKDL
jgi:hypothetical protein